MNKVKTFLDVAGVTGTPEDIALYKKLLAEEGSEFLHAWAIGDEVEMLDGICDVQFIYRSLYILDNRYLSLFLDMINGFYNISGFSRYQVNIAYDIVCDSNLSKFDKTEQEANETYRPVKSGLKINVIPVSMPFMWCT